jgi:transketolase
MIRTHCCYGRANVKLMGAYAGLSDSFDGPTHHSYTDLAIMRSLPHMTVVVPADPTSIASFVSQAADWDGPLFMRVCRNEVPALFGRDYAPKIGKAVTVREGTDVTVIGCGIPLGRCLEAADGLGKQGISVRVIEMHTLKPLDTDAILAAAADTGAIVTVEEGTVIGGLGAAVAETVCEADPVPVVRVGVPDTFAETGPYDAILDRYGLAVDDIVAAARRAGELKG